MKREIVKELSGVEKRLGNRMKKIARNVNGEKRVAAKRRQQEDEEGEGRGGGL